MSQRRFVHQIQAITVVDLPKKQHYVPQFLLRGFQATKKGQIHVFDKPQERVFCTSIQNIAAECGFYDYTVGATRQSAEPSLARMESDCAKIIKRIRDSGSLAFLKPKDRGRLALFVGIQLLRVKNMRDLLESMNARLHDMVVAMGGDPKEVEGCCLDADSLKAQSVQMLRIAKELSPHIGKKAWVLMRAPASSSLQISDNPVALQSTSPQPQFQGLGIGVDGIEVYLPISSRLIMLFLCPKLATQFVKGARTAQILKQQFGFSPLPSHLIPLASAIKTGAAFDITQENVDNLNSLQVLSATRFVFSTSREFAVAKEMLSKDPELKHRRTFRVM